MKENTKTWWRIIFSMLIFNSIIIIVLIYSKLISPYTITLKILLDITIAFITDKTISKLKIGWKDGFSVERNST